MHNFKHMEIFWLGVFIWNEFTELIVGPVHYILDLFIYITWNKSGFAAVNNNAMKIESETNRISF
jgi:hypothetical protein